MKREPKGTPCPTSRREPGRSTHRAPAGPALPRLAAPSSPRERGVRTRGQTGAGAQTPHLPTWCPAAASSAPRTRSGSASRRRQRSQGPACTLGSAEGTGCKGSSWGRSRLQPSRSCPAATGPGKGKAHVFAATAPKRQHAPTERITHLPPTDLMKKCGSTAPDLGQEMLDTLMTSFSSPI